MNIFATNLDPFICAMEHNSTHVTKQILENYQILSTVTRKFESERDCAVLYKETHRIHPCVLWAGRTKSNYEWLVALTEALGEVYTVRRGLVHKSEEKLLERLVEPPKGIPHGGLTKHVLCLPDHVAMSNDFDVEKSYQAYVNNKCIEWLQRDKPIVPKWEVEVPSWISPIVKAMIIQTRETQ